ncbi:MAG: aldehyde ferredoxin oxidoreductase family protein [Thermodesulfobacteriota bacterium]
MASVFKGYTGKILDINLTDGSIGEYPLSDTDRERFLGGRFISTKILWDQLKPGIDPLGEENLLIAMTSPLTGTGAPCSSRFDISAKSPLTLGIGHSNSGGRFGIHLKRAGFDGVVVRGRAETPVYIDINEDEARILPADELWGSDTEKTQQALGKGGKLVIGPAGENMVKYAVIVSHERVHGRCGMGAVMGSKNLKAIVANGKKKIELFDTPGFRNGVKKWVDMLKKHPATGDLAPRYGTAQFVNTLNRKNALPTRNYARGNFAGAYNLSGERMAADFLKSNTGCPTCPIRCGRVVEFEGKRIKGPEFETLCLMGSNLEIDDMEAIIAWNYEMDLLGMDTISTGNALGFAMELNEKGLWDNGLYFGKKENISAVIRDIAYKRGIGEDLAGGVRYLSEKYGGKDFAAHVKGLEIAGYSPRAAIGHALGYATANRGACHLDGGYVVYFEINGPMTLDPGHYRSKPAWAVLDQNLLAAISAAGSCLFTSWTFVPPAAFSLPKNPSASRAVTKILTHTWGAVVLLQRLPSKLFKLHLPMLPHSKFLHLATGMKMDFGRFLKAGERGYTLERLFNLREGIGKKQDTLARRFTHEPLNPKDPKSVVPLDKMLPEYYRIRRWDENGIPTPAALRRMDLDFVNLRDVRGT